MQRYAQVIRLKSEHREEYIRYHEAVWPGVLATIAACSIRNYSIYLHDDLLFAYFEYHGTDYAADMRRMAADPETQRWWAIMDPMQEPLATVQQGQRWFELPEVFHTDRPSAPSATTQDLTAKGTTMSEITRRRFGTNLLLAAPCAAITAGGLAAQETSPMRPPADAANATSTDLGKWPKGYTPLESGTAIANRFTTSPHLRPNRILYPEVCAWYGALEIARITQNKDLLAKLQARFEPLFSTEAPLLPPRGEHVDFSMFGALPLEFYLITQDKRYLDMGLGYADAQWAKPDAAGLTPETRFWIDDMYMITIVQVQAFRATHDAKYLDRAAREMAAYLDKLQQPNGLFFHAPDVPFFWGRGNGWFAAGMTELLRELPHTHPQYPRIERGYRTMMASLLKFQSADGTWRQLIDHPEAWPETSGTGMFLFALVSGVRSGLLDGNIYSGVAHRAWLALAGYVDQNSDVTGVCEGTNKLNDLEYYLLRKRRTGDFHGQAPAMWSAAALLRST